MKHALIDFAVGAFAASLFAFVFGALVYAQHAADAAHIVARAAH